MDQVQVVRVLKKRWRNRAVRKKATLALGLLVLGSACSPMDKQKGRCAEFERLVGQITTRGGMETIAYPDGGPGQIFFKERMYWKDQTNSTTNACKVDVTFMPAIGMAEALKLLDEGKDPRSPDDTLVNISSSYYEHVFMD